MFLVILFTFSSIHLASTQVSNYTFPENFLFGVATASYQIEGGWNEDGRTDSDWDYSLHQNPDYIDDKSNGDVACDSYHKWREDIQLVKNLGTDFYRFSISWSRILPSATNGSELNEKGVKYYNDLINGLLAEGIQPCVTIYHWDTPQILEFKGGWMNETIIEHYVYYAKLLFVLFGDRVKWWITFNEFNSFCESGYATGTKAPFKKMQGTGGYLSFHNAIQAHGRIYRVYENEFKTIQKGQIGVTIDCIYGVPASDSKSDKIAAELYMQFNYGWYVHPIILGNYPPVMIERIAEKSRAEGFNKSRLPEFTTEQIEMIKGSFDFLGLNHYTTYACTLGGNFSEPSHNADCGVTTSTKASWKNSTADWLFEFPQGFRALLNWIKDHYNNPPVLITENGWATKRGLNDKSRIEYTKSYLAELLKAVFEDGCNVIGYTHWSLIDNFEWTYGYTQKFGLVDIDFDSPNRTRTPKESYSVYQKIIKTKRLD